MPKNSLITTKCPIYNVSPITAHMNRGCRCEICIIEKKKYDRFLYVKNHEKRLASATKFRQKHPERIKATREKSKGYMQDWWITHTYGIDINVYRKMQIEQNNKCYLCGNSHKNGKKLYLDHDHKTKRIRKLLCCRCNTTIGLVNDNVQLLNTMIDYIIDRR